MAHHNVKIKKWRSTRRHLFFFRHETPLTTHCNHGGRRKSSMLRYKSNKTRCAVWTSVFEHRLLFVFEFPMRVRLFLEALITPPVSQLTWRGLGIHSWCLWSCEGCQKDLSCVMKLHEMAGWGLWVACCMLRVACCVCCVREPIDVRVSVMRQGCEV